jgi:hypothetical protein
MPTPPSSPGLADVLLRAGRPDDDADLARLAELDSERPLAGPTLVAEKDGMIVAALCQSTGRAVADPFAPSSLHLVDLLRRHLAGRRARAATRGRLLPRLALGAGWVSSGPKRW